MNTKLIAGGTLASLALTGILVGSVSAQTAAESTGLTEAQAVEIALLEVPGEVLNVEMERDDCAKLFEIEILGEDGQEYEVEVDAKSGDVLEIEGEDQIDD